MKSNRIIAGVTAGTLTIALAMTPAHAETTKSDLASSASASATATSYTSEVSEQELDQLAGDLQVLFEDVIVTHSDGTKSVDEDAAIEAFGPTQGRQLAQRLQSASAQTSRMATTSSTVAPMSRGSYSTAVSAQNSYAECVVDTVVPDAAKAVLTGILIDQIMDKQYRQAAETILKAVGKSAVRGGIPGLVASLSVASIWCMF